MKIRDLIAELQKYDGNDIVVLSRDEEGNGFRELRITEECVYADGETYPRFLTKYDIEAGFTDHDLYHGDDGVNAICLWP